MKTIFNPYKAKLPKVDSIKVTKEAFKKMNLYAGIVSEIIGGDKECIGTLLDHENSYDNVVRDVYLCKDQIVTSTSSLPGELQDSYEEARKKGMKVIGFWHSHGDLYVFHSPDDISFLSNRYKETDNKIVTGEREKDIEQIVEGETIRLFEKGSNKEIRIEGDVNNIKFIEREEYNVLNSIVINKNSYGGGYKDPKSGQEYNAEVWIGNDKANKRFQNINLKLIDETNNISLEDSMLVQEVGEKTKFQDKYLKYLPNYQTVLNKHKKNEKFLDQILEENKKKVSLEKNLPFSQKTISGKGYYKRIYEFYSKEKAKENKINHTIGLFGEILAGDYYEKNKRCWFWEDRIKKIEGLYKEVKKEIDKEQYNPLGGLLDILNVNYYAKKKHGKRLQKMCKKIGFKGKLKINRAKRRKKIWRFKKWTKKN